MTEDEARQEQAKAEQAKQDQAKQDQAKQGRKGKAADLLSLVSYTRSDPFTGADHPVVGVVVAVDDQALTVRPLAGHAHRVTRDEAQVVTAEDDEV